MQLDKKKRLDPRSASRTPSASKEPAQPTRFISPINACECTEIEHGDRHLTQLSGLTVCVYLSLSLSLVLEFSSVSLSDRTTQIHL